MKATKALLCERYDQNLHKRGGLVYKTGKVYDLGKGIQVKLAKEKHPLTVYAGLGLQAVTTIEKGTCIGYFKIIETSKKEKKGYYNIKVSKNKFVVADNDSLMNKANTIAYQEDRKKMCNCVVKVLGKQVALKSTKRIRPGSMLWADYGSVATHYWTIQYRICLARLSSRASRRGTANSEDEDNDSMCRDCRKRHVELLMCDSCSVSICKAHVTKKEAFLLNKDHFFCEKCLQKPPAYPNRFKKRKILEENKVQKFLKQCNRRYCTTSSFLDKTWKSNLTKVQDMFKKANFEHVEILNLSGSFANDRVPWDRATVLALLQALQRSKSRVYAVNLGEIYFEEDALLELHRGLQETWIGFLFIEPRTNNIDTKALKGCFRRTNEIDKHLHPNGSNLSRNRKCRPAWYKAGSIAPWYDKENKRFLERSQMGKCFFSSLNSKYFQ